ncbi:MAG: inositol monophosphatase family protein [Candidatus Limnocylindrales bacterium]
MTAEAAVDRLALLELATSAARLAGAILLEGRRAGGITVAATKSSPTDVVTAMDRAAEAAIVAHLLAARPDDGLLGEEGDDRPGRSGVRWIVDPLDGTVNYLYDLPGWSVSIAAEAAGQTQVGVVLAPLAGELFAAVRGGGATLDGAPIHCTAGVPLARALVGTGFGYGADRRVVQAEILRAVLPRVRDIRRLGSAAVDLCAVACGRLDAHYERGLKPWDLAAGGLIATEAGATVGGLHGAPAAEAFTLAAAPDLFAALHQLLAPLRPDRDA